MSATPESTLANPAQRIVDLESQLAECKAELDKAQRNLNETTTERAEALARETATAEVLRVINSSPGNLAPVFDAILEKARTLCEGTFGALFLAEADELFRAVAMRGGTASWHERIRRGFAGSETPASAPLLAGERFVHIVDLARIDHPMARAAVEAVGVRTFLSVPLRKDNTIVGMIFISRGEVRPFTDKQIALLQNFAAQAVIAMENARLLTETREALEQQTATAEVLGVINSSPGELKPVFDAILDKAHSLCGVEYGVLLTYDGELFWPVAMHGAPPSLEMRNGFRPSSGFRGLLRGERLLHIHDMAEVAAQRPDEPVYRDLFESGGILTQLAVPLHKDGRLLGIITANRREVKPFSDRQIALLENFAAQAVIAIENARLITETREALEQQTATAEVLQVINSSPDDLAPVFDAMLEKAMRLCGADFGVMNRYDGKHFYHAADNGVPSAYARYRRERGPITYGSGTTPARLVAGENLIHTANLMATEAYERGEPARRALVDLGGARTHLTAALRKGDVLLGDISIYRQEVRPFTDKQIALLQNFAAQAVIAMENARLLTETREALEQQTATAEVLQVINSSPGDLTPVFDAILEKAHRLCGAAHGGLVLYDGEYFRPGVSRGYPASLVERLRQGYRPAASHPMRRLLTGDPYVHVSDLAEVDDPAARSVVELGGIRTTLFVALRKDDELLGMFTAARDEVHPFSDKEITLLQNFAAQAVIAMDNARLLDEIRQRQAELRVTFDNMGDGVAMFDSELRLAAWNLNFQRILDVSDELLAERPNYSDYIRFLAQRGEFGNADVETELSRRLEAIGQELRFEHTRPDGRVIEVRRNAVPGGGFVIIYGDVTERKRAEAEIRDARDTAERALGELQTAQASLVHAQKMAALGQLTAGIAHEIKNPLNFVNNFAELSGELLLELKETTAPAVAALGDDERAAVAEVVETLRGNLDKIAEHGKRADGIVKSMLEHSRGVSGERRVVDLNALIEEALNLAYHGARAQDASFNITLEREFDRGLAPTELAPQEMTRVFLNLFGNGFYATTRRQRDGAGPDFRPTLRVATRDLGDAVEVRVRDNGTGVAPEIRDKLFQPFVTTKPTGEGTGLGLSIAYDIVTQQHGGTISVDSHVGEFTEFTIRLPRA